MPLAKTPSPTMVCDPITVPDLTMLLAPTTVRSPKTAPSVDEPPPPAADARSTSIVPIAAPGPMTHPNPIRLFLMYAPAPMLVLFITMLLTIEVLWPIRHLDPIKPDRISVWLLITASGP